MTGVPIDNIKLHANWSLNSPVSEHYYYKPENQYTVSVKRYQEDSHIESRNA